MSDMRQGTNEYDLAIKAIDTVASRNEVIDGLEAVTRDLALRMGVNTQKIDVLTQRQDKGFQAIGEALHEIAKQQEAIVSHGKAILDELSKIYKLFDDMATLP